MLMQNNHKNTPKLLSSPHKTIKKTKYTHDVSLSINCFPEEHHVLDTNASIDPKTFPSTKNTALLSSNLSLVPSKPQLKLQNIEPTRSSHPSTKSSPLTNSALKKNDSIASVQPFDAQGESTSCNTIEGLHASSWSPGSACHKGSLENCASSKSDAKVEKEHVIPRKDNNLFCVSNSSTHSTTQSSSPVKKREIAKRGGSKDQSLNLRSPEISAEEKVRKGYSKPPQKLKSPMQGKSLKVAKDSTQLNTMLSPVIVDKKKPQCALGENDGTLPFELNMVHKTASGGTFSNSSQANDHNSPLGNLIPHQELCLAGFKPIDRDHETSTVEKRQRLLRDKAHSVNASSAEDNHLRGKHPDKVPNHSFRTAVYSNHSMDSSSEVIITLPSALMSAELRLDPDKPLRFDHGVPPVEPRAAADDADPPRRLSPSTTPPPVDPADAGGPTPTRRPGLERGSSRAPSVEPPPPLSLSPPLLVEALPLSRSRRSPLPLHNYGHTCYMNATLQCLLHTPHLVERLEADVRRMRRTRRNGNDKGTDEETDRDGDGNGAKKTDGEGEPCACAPATESLIGLARSDEEGGGSEGFLLRLKDIAAARNEQFSNGQNDAHEFLRTILHAVHEEINRRGRAPYTPIENIPEETAAAAMARWMAHLRGLDDSTVYDFFGGVLCSRCECLSCQNVSLTFDPFLDLSLPIALTPTTPSLRGKTPKSTKGGASGEKGSAFQFFSSSKAASRDEKGSRCAAEAVDIVLRESCMADTYEMLNGGNQLFCDKCKKLCDGRRCSNVALWPRILVLHLKRFDGSGKKNDANIIYPKTFMLRDVRYRLYAVCCHSGSESCGHYTNYVALDEAVVKQSDSNIILDACGEETPSKAPCRSTMEKWYLCNDKCISEVDAKTAFSALGNAYILFYYQQ